MPPVMLLHRLRAHWLDDEMDMSGDGIQVRPQRDLEALTE
jgi:hypothetical protein